MISFRNWITENTNTVTFTTSKGSVYHFSSGRSQRNKADHQYHDPKDIGTKEISDRTVFVQQQFAREIGMWGASSGQKKRLVLAEGKVYLLSWNEVAGKHGLDKLISDNSFSVTPAVGLCPLELWNKDISPWTWIKPGMDVYKSSHPGNQIIKIEDNQV